ncbi:Decaprenyl-diphosphate synthase subunit 1 [Balamuthia mandrillaris]
MKASVLLGGRRSLGCEAFAQRCLALPVPRVHSLHFSGARGGALTFPLHATVTRYESSNVATATREYCSGPSPRTEPKEDLSALSSSLSRFAKQFRKASFDLSSLPSLPSFSPSSASSSASSSSASTSAASLANGVTEMLQSLWQRGLSNGSNHPANPLKAALAVIEEDLRSVNQNIRRQISDATDRSKLAQIASYFFKLEGKRLRPVVVLLVSKATTAQNLATQLSSTSSFSSSPSTSSSPHSLTDSVTANGSASSSSKDLSQYVLPEDVLKGIKVSEKQSSLAEIMEMIHTASLVHDDIIDESDTRRGSPTTHKLWGTKKAVLAGDFLLARASVKIARLYNHEVTELLATVISHLVEGEFFQMKDEDSDNFQQYLTKTYLKTASLIEKSSRCAALLGGADNETVSIATEYGKHLGMAFQVHSSLSYPFEPFFCLFLFVNYSPFLIQQKKLIDDMLDFTSTSDNLGKPAAVDLSLGLATAPVLYAMEEYPEMRSLIERRFKEEGDIDKAWTFVRQSNGIERTFLLAKKHSQEAALAVSKLAPSPARDALVWLADAVLQRSR